MDIAELNKALRADAKEKKACASAMRKWKDDFTEQELVGFFFDNLDFCIEAGFPSNAFIKENFELGTLRLNGILIDDKYSLLKPQYAYIAGSSETNLRYNSFSVGQVYVLDNASVNLTAKNMSHVIIHLYGQCHLKASASDAAAISVFVHSPKVGIEFEGNVKIKDA